MMNLTPTKKKYPVEPKVGMAFIFDHDLLHSVPEMETNGIKYCVRSDIMFRREGKLTKPVKKATSTTNLYRAAQSHYPNSSPSVLITNILSLDECYSMRVLPTEELKQKVNNKEFWEKVLKSRLRKWLPKTIKVDGETKELEPLRKKEIKSFNMKDEEIELADIIGEEISDEKLILLLSLNKRGNVSIYREGQVCGAGMAPSGALVAIPSRVIRMRKHEFRLKQGSHFLVLDADYK